jgi:hypothetical protein
MLKATDGKHGEATIGKHVETTDSKHYQIMLKQLLHVESNH